jgi:hypothetical protein
MLLASCQLSYLPSRDICPREVIDTLTSAWHGLPMTAHTTASTTARAVVTPAEDSLLRLALKGDAAITALNAIGYLAAFWLLDGWLGVPGALLIAVGAFLLAFAAFVGRLAAQHARARAAVAGVVAANALWVVDSVIVLAVDAWSPTLGGQIVIAVQAAGVAGLAALQYVGLRRAARP